MRTTSHVVGSNLPSSTAAAYQWLWFSFTAFCVSAQSQTLPTYPAYICAYLGVLSKVAAFRCPKFVCTWKRRCPELIIGQDGPQKAQSRLLMLPRLRSCIIRLVSVHPSSHGSFPCFRDDGLLAGGTAPLLQPPQHVLLGISGTWMFTERTA